RVGKRLRWYNEVDETFGGRTEETAAAVRTKEGRAAQRAAAHEDDGGEGASDGGNSAGEGPGA
ncbi:MAG: hypothetical protein WCN81_10420, partial [Actinomycetes bacterium]